MILYKIDIFYFSFTSSFSFHHQDLILNHEEEIEIINDIELAQLLPHHRITTAISGFAAGLQGSDLVINFYHHYCISCYEESRRLYQNHLKLMACQRVMISSLGSRMTDHVVRKVVLKPHKSHRMLTSFTHFDGQLPHVRLFEN